MSRYFLLLKEKVHCYCVQHLHVNVEKLGLVDHLPRVLIVRIVISDARI